MIKAILSILGGALQGIGSWMSSYSSKENTKARLENDKVNRKDQFNEAVKNNDIDTKRKLLS